MLTSQCVGINDEPEADCAKCGGGETRWGEWSCDCCEVCRGEGGIRLPDNKAKKCVTCGGTGLKQTCEHCGGPVDEEMKCRPCEAANAADAAEMGAA